MLWNNVEHGKSRVSQRKVCVLLSGVLVSVGEGGCPESVILSRIFTPLSVTNLGKAYCMQLVMRLTTAYQYSGFKTKQLAHLDRKSFLKGSINLNAIVLQKAK